MEIKKSGCILIDFNNKKIGLVYRNKHNDYSFPKGHKEEGETLEECALRETEEETGRVCKIVNSKELPALEYTDSAGDKTKTYFYIAKDLEQSRKKFDSSLVHELIWLPIKDVEEKLTYDNMSEFWKKIKPIVNEVLNNEDV